MRNGLVTGLVLLLAGTSFIAFAREPWVDVQQRLTAEQLHETGLDTLTPEQLARLNELLREESAKAGDGANARDGEDRNFYIGLDDKPIRSRVKGSLAGWEPGTDFVLENGQRWRVLKGSLRLPKVLQDPPIVVVPGIAGRWFLQVDEDLPKARVYRID